MRRSFSKWLIAAFLMAGCYSPQIGSPGFFCHATDNPACPDGQHCANGRCVTGSVSAPHDLGDVDFSSVVSDSGTPTYDFSQAPRDLSQPQSVPDLSQPPACLASGTACDPNNDQCCTICFIAACL
ncbi:MAG: hypothetical protein ACHQ17_05710 [Polyangia bacterium]|jgi:hypothetical protein